MTGPYSFIGLSTLGYPAYADLDTGRMLVAEPGRAYGIRAIDGGAIPPPDGRWAEASANGYGGAPPSPPPVPPVPSVPDAEESAA